MLVLSLTKYKKN